MYFESKNPSTKEVLKTFNEITNEELELKLQKANSAFLSWRNTPLEKRKELFFNLANYLRENKEILGEMASLEMGKTKTAGIGEVLKCADCVEYYANNAEEFLKEISYDGVNDENYISIEPIGTILAIMPWNFPFWQVYRFLAPALIAGNTALLKHASNVPQCAQAIEDSLTFSGFPEGVFQNLFISTKRIEDVISDDRVKAVTLTGSEKAGSAVASIAGRNIKKTVLELGGSDPFIVCKDADIPLAAKTALLTRLQNNAGQSCIAAKRFIVHESIKDEFLQNLIEEIKKIEIGNPLEENIKMGPLVNENALNEISNQVNASIAKGAKLIYGGDELKIFNLSGYFYNITVLDNVTSGMSVYDEEVFGPVLPIITFKEELEAIEIANDTPYGLGATIFSKDEKRAKTLARDIEAGSVFINAQVISQVNAPFGGVKKSGYGRELGEFGLREFVNIKNLSIKKT